MSYDVNEVCGLEWFADGKDHKCDINPPAGCVPHRCTCSCGQVRRKGEGPRTVSNPSGKRLKVPLKLAKWKRGRKVTP